MINTNSESRAGNQSSVTSLLANVVERRPIGQEKGYSGAAVERVELADGRSLIVKRISAETDFSMRLTHDRGRAATLWINGVLQRLPAAVDPAMVAAERDGDGWILVMRDVAGSLISEGKILSRQETRRIIEAMIAVHNTYHGENIPELCTLADLFAAFSPKVIVQIQAESKLFVSWVLRGWEYFATMAPPDVNAAVQEILGEPALLSRALEELDPTLIHADLYIENIGLYPDRVVFLDWGLATYAPSAVDFTAFLAMNSLRLEGSLDEVSADFRRISNAKDDQRAMQLAMLGAVVQYGWRMAMFVEEWGEPEQMSRIEAEFEWWMRRATLALGNWSPK